MNDFTQILKFGAVGFSGVLVDFAVTWLLKEKLKLNKYFANSVGFLCAASNNYFFNRIWTFQNSDPDILRQYIEFMGVSLVGLAINNSVVWFTHSKKGMNFYVSKVVAVLVVMFWNYLINKYYTFA